MKQFIFLSVLLLLVSGNTQSAPFTYTSSKFEFDPLKNSFSILNDKVWNPSAAIPITGIAAKFHMQYDPRITSCGTMQTCSIASCFEQSATGQAFIQALVGIGNSTRWAPKCPTNGNFGISFAATSTNAGTGYDGIGLFTDTRDITGNYFLPKSSTDRGEIYIEFPTEAVPTATMKPFSASCDWANNINCKNEVRMRVRAYQGVALSAPTNRTQTKQKASVVLRNTAVSGNHRIEWSVNTFCEGIGCVGGNANYYLSSPAENRLWVGGDLQGSGGTPTNLVSGTCSRTNAILESYTAATPHYAPVAERLFRYEVSWSNFVKTLRHLTCLRSGGVVDGSYNPDVAEVFGNGWSLPENWELANVLFGQEVKNEYWQQGDQVYMGGHMGYVQVKAYLRP